MVSGTKTPGWSLLISPMDTSHQSHLQVVAAAAVDLTFFHIKGLPKVCLKDLSLAGENNQWTSQICQQDIGARVEWYEEAADKQN